MAGSAAAEIEACTLLSDGGRMNPLLLPGRRRIWAMVALGATVADFFGVVDWRDTAPDADTEREKAWGREWDSLLNEKGWRRILAWRRWDAAGRPHARTGPARPGGRRGVTEQAAEYLDELAATEDVGGG